MKNKLKTIFFSILLIILIYIFLRLLVICINIYRIKAAYVKIDLYNYICWLPSEEKFIDKFRKDKINDEISLLIYGNGNIYILKYNDYYIWEIGNGTEITKLGNIGKENIEAFVDTITDDKINEGDINYYTVSINDKTFGEKTLNEINDLLKQYGANMFI